MIFFCRSLWNLKAGWQQQPWVAVRPLESFCPSVQVRTIFSSVCAAPLMCAMFFTCFHVIFASYPERRGFERALHGRHACVCVCVRVFCLLWAGFRSLFLFSALPLKENPLGFYKRSVPCTLTACPDMPKWKTVLHSLLWYLKQHFFLLFFNFHVAVLKKSGCYMNAGDFHPTGCAGYCCVRLHGSFFMHLFS